MSDFDKAEDGDSVSRWEPVSERTLAKCRVFDLVERRFRHPKRGAEGDFYVLETNDWVMVLPVTERGEVVMVRQFRFGVQSFSWELPGGIMDAGEEDPVWTGVRELAEETGYEASRTRILGSSAANPAILNNRCHFVLAEGVTPTARRSWDEHEEIEVKLFPLAEVYAMAHRGEIIHSLALNALLLYYPSWRGK